MADLPVTRTPRGDRTRAALVAAALELFGRKGVEATSVDEITTAAAVAKGTFYVHFQRKQDVLLERAAELILMLAADPAVTDTERDPVAAIEGLGVALAAWMEDKPRPVMGRAVREILGNRDHWLRVLADRPTLAQILEPIMARGQRAGVLRTDQSPRRLAQALTIMWLDNIIGWSERAQPRPLIHDLGRASALFLDGAASGHDVP